MMSTVRGAESAAVEGARNRLSQLLRIVAPTTVLTALLYFYGYVSLKAYYSYFGISLSVLDLSTTDYLVRTPDTLFRPLAALVLVLVCAYVGHYVLVEVLKRAGPTSSRWVALSAGLAGVGFAVLGLVGLYGSPRGYWSPLALAAAAMLVEYSVWLLTELGAPAEPVQTFLASGADWRRGLVIALVVVGTFWAVNELAQERGVDNARLTEQTLPIQPQAVVYSAQDLQLPGPGVDVVAIDEPHSAYAFRANGLRPLLYANGRWFLLPVGWQHDRAGSTVIVMEDKPLEIRVDLAPGGAPTIVR